jgi:hypothetical protein
MFVARSAPAIAKALELLVEMSTHVSLVGPFFRADRRDRVDVLIALCRALPNGSRVHVHWSDQGPMMPSHAHCMTEAAKLIVHAVTWEGWLVADGREYRPFKIIDELEEDNPSTSGVVNVLLRSR